VLTHAAALTRKLGGDASIYPVVAPVRGLIQS